jgi:hypothetical protein
VVAARREREAERAEIGRGPIEIAHGDHDVVNG